MIIGSGSSGKAKEMEDLAQVLYLVIFIFAVCGAWLLLRRRNFPPGWKPETYEKNRNSPMEPFPPRKPDSFFKKH